MNRAVPAIRHWFRLALRVGYVIGQTLVGHGHTHRAARRDHGIDLGRDAVQFLQQAGVDDLRRISHRETRAINEGDDRIGDGFGDAAA